MASAESPAQQPSWRPHLPAHRRLAADPRDFRRFRCGERVGVYLGHCWSGAVVQQVGTQGVLVRTQRQGERQRCALRVCDARNMVPLRRGRQPERRAAGGR